jgi:hypothetical protein
VGTTHPINQTHVSTKPLHRTEPLETLDSKRVLIRNLSCYCESCIAADGVEPCLNLAQVGNSDETVPRISPGPDNDQETDLSWYMYRTDSQGTMAGGFFNSLYCKILFCFFGEVQTPNYKRTRWERRTP